MPGFLSDALAWLSIATFVVGALLAMRNRHVARTVTTAAWGLFAVFWLQLVPHFAFVHKSYIEGILTIVAVPACLYTGYTLYRGRDSLFVLSRAVAAMGLVYLPFETIPAISLAGQTYPAPREFLIETVAAQTGYLMGVLGYFPELTVSDQGYMSRYLFVTPEGHGIAFTVVLACTGIGSMAIFAGLIAAVRAPMRRKLRALAVSLPVIYALNVVRVVFIGIVFGKQYLQIFVDEVLFLFGDTDPYAVSFYLSDRVISQFLAVVALVAITYLVLRELPELITVIEDLLYLVTGEEYDLAAELDLPRDPSDQSLAAD
jgi:archaeosortase A (PGF-CTERM-specific)